MELEQGKELAVTSDALKYAKIISAQIKNPIQRKRAFASIVALDSFADYMLTKEVEVSITKNLFKIAPINEEFEIADVYYNNWKLDIRVVTDNEFLSIPKSHFNYDIVADFYIAIKVDKNLEKAEFVGFVTGESVSKTVSSQDYYLVELGSLGSFDELLTVLESEKSVVVSDNDHEQFRSLFLSYLDNDMEYISKKRMMQHLIACAECRADFVEFFDFEAIVRNSSAHPNIFEDHTLDFIGCTAVDKDEYKGKEELIDLRDLDSSDASILDELFDSVAPVVPVVAPVITSTIPLPPVLPVISKPETLGIDETFGSFDGLFSEPETSAEEDLKEDTQQQEFVIDESSASSAEVLDLVEESEFGPLLEEGLEELNLDDISLDNEFEPISQASQEIEDLEQNVEIADFDEQDFGDLNLSDEAVVEEQMDSLEPEEQDELLASEEFQDFEENDETFSLDNEIADAALTDSQVEDQVESDLDVFNDLNEGFEELDFEEFNQGEDILSESQEETAPESLDAGDIMDSGFTEELNEGFEELNLEENSSSEEMFSFTEEQTSDMPLEPEFKDFALDDFEMDNSEIESFEKTEEGLVESSLSEEGFDIELDDEFSKLDISSDVDLDIAEHDSSLDADVNDDFSSMEIASDIDLDSNVELFEELLSGDEGFEEYKSPEQDVDESKQKYQDMFKVTDTTELTSQMMSKELSKVENDSEGNDFDNFIGEVEDSTTESFVNTSDNEISLTENQEDSPQEEKVENSEIGALYSDDNSFVGGSNQGQEMIGYMEKADPANKKKMIILSSCLAGCLLLACVLGIGNMIKGNKQKAELANQQMMETEQNLPYYEDTNLPQAQGQNPDMGGTEIPGVDQAPGALDASAANDLARGSSARVPKDMNKVMTNVFDENPSTVSVTKLYWEVPQSIASNKMFALYLQQAGKNIKTNLKMELINATEFAYNNKVKVNILLGRDNKVKKLEVLDSSGSEQIDAIVLQTIKGTLPYINVPQFSKADEDRLLRETKTPLVNKDNLYDLKLVINF